jgi:DNA-directed RNA polymerase specialized sigma24 family protein
MGDVVTLTSRRARVLEQLRRLPQLERDLVLEARQLRASEQDIAAAMLVHRNTVRNRHGARDVAATVPAPRASS